MDFAESSQRCRKSGNDVLLLIYEGILTPNFRDAKICKLCGRLDLTKLADGLARRGPLLEAVRASGRPIFGVRPCVWGLCRRGAKTLSPQGATKKGFNTFRARRERGPG